MPQYEVHVEKKFDLKFTIPAFDRQEAEQLAVLEAKLRIFHDETPSVTAMSCQEVAR